MYFRIACMLIHKCLGVHIGIQVPDLQTMNLREIRKIWRVTHRRWHSSRRYQEKKIDGAQIKKTAMKQGKKML